MLKNIYEGLNIFSLLWLDIVFKGMQISSIDKNRWSHLCSHSGCLILAALNNFHLRLDNYISELLYRNDCVIIPGLGGFVANTRSAFLNPTQHTFHPPAKKIAFNAGLRTNDGLLAHHVSKAKNISYSEAISVIQLFVEKSFQLLQSGEILQINLVGTLRMDREKHLQFEPDTTVNFLPESFGLTTIHSPAIRRDEPSKVKPGRVIKTIQPETKTSPRKIRKLWELIPAAAVLTFLAFSPSTIQQINSGIASIIPAPAPVVIPAYQHKKYKSVAIYPPFVKNETAASSSNNSTTADNSSPAKNNSEINSSTPVAAEKNPAEIKNKPVAKHEIAAPESTKVAPPAIESTVTTKQFYVIGGCFLIEENAVKFRDEAIAKGYQAAIIGKNDKGIEMVSLYSSAKHDDAKSQADVIKEKFEKGAWVFSK